MKNSAYFTIFHIRYFPHEEKTITRLLNTFERIVCSCNKLRHLELIHKPSNSIVLLKLYSSDQSFFNSLMKNRHLVKFLHLAETYLAMKPNEITNV